MFHNDNGGRGPRNDLNHWSRGGPAKFPNSGPRPQFNQMKNHQNHHYHHQQQQHYQQHQQQTPYKQQQQQNYPQNNMRNNDSPNYHNNMSRTPVQNKPNPANGQHQKQEKPNQTGSNNSTPKQQQTPNQSNNKSQLESTPKQQTVPPVTPVNPKKQTPVQTTQSKPENTLQKPFNKEKLTEATNSTEGTSGQQRPTKSAVPSNDPPNEEDDDSTNTKLFIATVKEGITDQEFRELFSKFGNVTNAFLHKTKWFGLITFETHDQADAARKHYSNSNILKLKWAQNNNKETPLILNQEQTSTKRESSSKCRLFIGNISPGVTEENIRQLVEPFGTVAELFVRPNRAFCFVRFATRQNAESAKNSLDGTIFFGKQIEVRFASQGTILKVRNISPFVSNELLHQAFEPFGELERATVFADERGKSLCEGILEFSRKPVAVTVYRKAQQDCLLLTSSPLPVVIEPSEIRDDEDGYNEKMINKQSHAYLKEREKGPRFAEKGSFEFDFALKWKELMSLEKAKKRQLDIEFQNEKQRLMEEMDLMRYDYEIESLKRKLAHLASQKDDFENRKIQAERLNRERDEELKTARRALAIRQAEILGYTYVDEAPSTQTTTAPPYGAAGHAGGAYGSNTEGRPSGVSGTPATNPLFSGHPVADAVLEAAMIPGDQSAKPSAAAESFLKNWTTYTQGAPPPPPPSEGAKDSGTAESAASQQQKVNNQNKPAYLSYIGQMAANRKRNSDNNSPQNDKRKRCK